VLWASTQTFPSCSAILTPARSTPTELPRLQLQPRLPPRRQPPQTNPIAWYKFDETSGTTASDSSGTNHASLISNPPFITGKLGNAFSLNGTNQYARISRTTQFESPAITISAWIKRNGTQVSYANVFRKTWQNNASLPYVSYSLQLNPSGTDPSAHLLHGAQRE
jgi:hypothetical protein